MPLFFITPMEEKSFYVSFQETSYKAHYIKTEPNALKHLSRLMTKDCLFGIDTETKGKEKFKTLASAGLSPHLGVVRLLQIFDGEEAYLFDFDYLSPEIFKEFLESKDFVAHYAKFDLSMLMALGFKGINMGCTLLACRLLIHATYPTDKEFSSLSLSSMVKTVLKDDILKVLQRSDWGKESLTFEQLQYAALDPICVLKIAEIVTPKLKKLGLLKVYKLYKNAQHPVVEMEFNGIGFCTQGHQKLCKKWRHDFIGARKKVLAETGLEEITGSKVGHWLEENLSPEMIAKWPKTPTGKLSTAGDTFTEFADLDVVQPFLEYQRYQKLLSTYGEKLSGHVNCVTNRIHCNFALLGARTGRMACTSPNLQNQPRDKDLRALYVAQPGHLLVSADYSQVEVRVAAELSEDQSMLSIYRKGADIYRETASRVLNKSKNNVTKEERQRMKAVVLGRLFGLGAEKFVWYAKTQYGVEVTPIEAEQFITGFKEAYPEFTEWQKLQGRNAEKNLTATTKWGKLRALDPKNFYGPALNHPVQGLAATCMLLAMCRFHASKQSSWKLISVIHDEINVEVPENEAEQAKEFLVTAMIEAYQEVFPTGVVTNLVEAKIGKNWAEVH